MKKEDLCMLLLVVALLFVVSRNTKLFEGFEGEEPVLKDIDMGPAPKKTPPPINKGRFL